MHKTGDFIPSGQPFNTEDWGESTATYMDHIVSDLTEKHWNSIFISLASFSVRALKEEAARKGTPEESNKRVPLPASDPPSPPCDD